MTQSPAVRLVTEMALANKGFISMPPGGSDGQALIRSGSGVAWTAASGLVSPSVSPAPSGGDDTAALSAWLTTTGVAGRVATLQPGTYRITGLTLPAGTTLYGYGATLTFLTPPPGALTAITLNTRCRIYGVEIDGTSAAGTGLYGITTVQNVTDLVVDDCRIHDIKGTGISFDHANRFRASGNVIGACTSNGIGVTFSTNGIFTDNVMTSNGGIEVWGGAANNPGNGVYGASNMIASNNSVLDGGGIFFASVRFFTITGNMVQNAPDVGIDLEGCADGTVTGNTSIDAVNGCFSLFFASARILFTGNRAINTRTSGRGAALGIFSSGFRCSEIVITGNDLTAAVGGIITDQDALGDSVISGNKIHITGQGIPILLLEAYDVSVSGNRISTFGARGISLDGSYDCTIATNRVIQVGGDSSTLGQNGGIFIYNRSATYPGNHNVVRGNKIAGFATGIADYGNANQIVDNSVDTVWHNQSNGAYVTFISGNRTLANPNTLATITAVP